MKLISPFGPALRQAWRALLTVAAITLGGGGCLPAHAQNSTRTFDHVKTGFLLNGVHGYQRCESCHVNGVFRGTPRDCASCHTSGALLAAQNVVKPQTHIPTTQTCDTCHNSVRFTGAKFNHAGVSTATCTTCHNGMTASGKPSGHIATTASCGTCHRTTAWLPATGMDHSQFTSATNCATCHNGSSATGKPATHIPTALNCSTCHQTTSWRPTKWNHTQQSVTNQCSTCHSGSYPPADGRPSNHIPYQTLSGVAISNCDTCHKSGYTNWFPGTFHNNVSISNQCATCHLTSVYGLTSKPSTATHATVTGNCENCHKTSSTWSSSKPDHSVFTTATVCTSCHNGTTATGKPSNHIPTTLNCIACHTPTSTFSVETWNHTQMPVAGQCATCHTGSYLTGMGKPSNHIPYQLVSASASANCDSCHKNGYTSWFPGAFHKNYSVSSQCATCHLTGVYGLTSKPNTSTHATVTGNCESCHKTTSAWSASKPDHSLFTVATVCTSCHNGVAATGKPGNHIPTTLNCIACHTPTSTFSVETWNHTQMPVAGQCATCHTGTYLTGMGKPSNHIPYQLIATAASANCDTCHKSGYTSWFPGRFHSNVAVTGQCSTCHGSGLYGLTTKPVNHIPLAQLLNGTSMECNACHTSTSSWTAMTMNHNNSLGNGAGWCKGCHQSGTSYLGNMEKKSLTHDKSTGVTDCSQSGCHRPLGNKGSTYRNWN